MAQAQAQMSLPCNYIWAFRASYYGLPDVLPNPIFATGFLPGRAHGRWHCNLFVTTDLGMTIATRSAVPFPSARRVR
jgi:hypothetical protein